MGHLTRVKSPQLNQLILKFKKPLAKALILQALADERLAPVHRSVRQSMSENGRVFGPTNGRFSIESFSAEKGIKTLPNPYFRCHTLFSNSDCQKILIEKPSNRDFIMPLKVMHKNPILYSPFYRSNAATAQQPFESENMSAARLWTSQILSLNWTADQPINAKSFDLANALALMLERQWLKHHEKFEWNQLNYVRASSTIIPKNNIFSALQSRWTSWSQEKKQNLARELLQQRQWDPKSNVFHLILLHRNEQEKFILEKIFKTLSQEKGFCIHHIDHLKSAIDACYFDILNHSDKISDPLILNLEISEAAPFAWSPERLLTHAINALKKNMNATDCLQYLQALNDVEEPTDFSDFRCQEYRELEAFLQRTHLIIPIVQACRDYYFSPSIENVQSFTVHELLQSPDGLFNWDNLNFFSDINCPYAPLAPFFILENTENI